MAVIARFIFFLAILSIASGCSPVQHISKTDVQYQTVQADSVPGDAQITAIIAPYKAQIDEQMNEVIGTLAKDLNKGKPESTLGDFVGDAMLAGALKEDPEVDFAMANYGGIRVPYMTAGPITVGKIYELSPFDNMLTIVHIPGSTLDALLHHIASVGGWPISMGLQMSIREDLLVEYLVKGEPVELNRIYKVALPDYIANGGDGLSELIPLERTQSGKLVRDLIIEYVKDHTKEGKAIDVSLDGRIRNLK